MLAIPPTIIPYTEILWAGYSVSTVYPIPYDSVARISTPTDCPVALVSSLSSITPSVSRLDVFRILDHNWANWNLEGAPFTDMVIGPTRLQLVVSPCLSIDGLVGSRNTMHRSSHE